MFNFVFVMQTAQIRTKQYIEHRTSAFISNKILKWSYNSRKRTSFTCHLW